MHQVFLWLTVYISAPQLSNIFMLMGLVIIICNLLCVQLFYMVNYTAGGWEQEILRGKGEPYSNMTYRHVTLGEVYHPEDDFYSDPELAARCLASFGAGAPSPSLLQNDVALSLESISVDHFLSCRCELRESALAFFSFLVIEWFFIRVIVLIIAD